jgi:hypothetical protein
VKKYFTKEDVDALLPRLTLTVRAIMDAHEALRAVEADLEAEQQRISIAGGGTIDRPAWQRAREAISRRTGEIEHGVREITALGGAPKDLSMGLVDFPGLRDGKEVNLCWRYGETSVEHWHGLDEGYAGRKRL